MGTKRDHTANEKNIGYRIGSGREMEMYLGKSTIMEWSISVN